MVQFCHYMFCRKCGREIPDRHSFCPYCGADQRKETTSFTTMLDIKEIKKNKVKKTKTNATSLAACLSFVISLFAILFDSFVFVRIEIFAAFGFIFSVGGLITSIIGLKHTKHNVKKGGPFAFAGFAISLISLLFLLIVVSLFLFYK